MTLKPTDVYDTFWHFAYERQRVFELRKRKPEPPYTGDPIIAAHRFTNVYRATDRASQYLIRNVIYPFPAEPLELLFKILLFKIFNSISTWQLIEETLSPDSYTSLPLDDIDRVLTKARNHGQPIYSGAYIMPSGKTSFGHSVKHRNHLQLLDVIVNDDPIRKIKEMRSLKQLYAYLRSKPTLGNFLAYQFAIDINYSDLTNFDESEFVVAGPGAISGVHKCFSNVKRGHEAQAIEYVRQSQEDEFEARGMDFPYLGGRRLQSIDVQNLFCEVDKYSRVKHPHIDGISGRKRIKRKFRANPQPIKYTYPPKWGMTP